MNVTPSPSNPADLIPGPDAIATFYTEIDRGLAENTPSWLPCLKEGCCDGESGCCQRGLNAAIPWTEAEQIWLVVKDMPIAQRRKIAATAAAQCEAAKATDPELFAALDKDEVMARDALQRLNTVMANVAEHPCPLLGIPEKVGNNGVEAARPYACSVHASRPTICRIFGQCSVTQMVTLETGENTTENYFLGCDIAHKSLAEHRDNAPEGLTLTSGTHATNYAQRMAAPRLNGMQTPLVMKPIPFWISDLTDPTGDITNPNNIFTSIRRMILQSLEVMAASIPPSQLQ